MFERYTEKARRVIFFARYEASQFGSPYIETEHLLLGLLREDKALTNRFLRSHASVESIRRRHCYFVAAPGRPTRPYRVEQDDRADCDGDTDECEERVVQVRDDRADRPVGPRLVLGGDRFAHGCMVGRGAGPRKRMWSAADARWWPC